MMVMWSTHDGRDDATGHGVTTYMEASEVLKPTPDGKWEKVRRNPPPEVLRGDAALMRQAINATPFQRRYSSCVLSFDMEDVDATAFNAGDQEARRRVAEVIQSFEDTAYAGIPEANRPPTFWTTHTHTGRLELNFCAPRGLLAGDGKIRSINPHPPGSMSRALWDAFRDTFNARYGWVDPEDPVRARLVKVPDWKQKTAAEALRAGHEVQRDPRELMAEWVCQRIEAGVIGSRNDLIEQLKEAGFAIPRAGKDYITIAAPDGERIRLKGPIFAQSFQSVADLGAAIRRGAGGNQRHPRRGLDDAEERLVDLHRKRAEFHRSRYDGPAWHLPAKLPSRGQEVAAHGNHDAQAVGEGMDISPGRHQPGVDYPRPAALGSGTVVHLGPPEADDAAQRHSTGDRGLGGQAPAHHDDQWSAGAVRPGGAPDRDDAAGNAGAVDEGCSVTAATEEERQRYKARLWTTLYGGTLPDEVLMSLRYVDTASKTVRLTDGAEIRDHGTRLTTPRTTEHAVKLMVAEAQAKGWTSITLKGSTEFKRMAAVAAVLAGLAVSNPELLDLVTAERLRLTAQTGGGDTIPADLSSFSSYRPVAPQGPPPPQAGSKEIDRNVIDANGKGAPSNRAAPRSRSLRAGAEADRADRNLDGSRERLEQERRAVAQRLRGLGQQVERGVAAVNRRRADDLNDLKAKVDLREVAAWLGFSEDFRASDRNHAVMRNSTGHKLVIGINAETGHWCFSDNLGNHGTAIDLVRLVKGGIWREVFHDLRLFTGPTDGRPQIDGGRWEPKPKPRPAPASADRMKAISEWERANLNMRSVFLERSRGISPQALASDRFKGTFRVDERQNAVFPYRDGTGAIVGTERRNQPPLGSDRSFKVYTSGAAPGIWTSNGTADDRRLVVAESPIDAMSHWQMLSAEEQEVTRYAAIRSGFREEDLEAIIYAMPDGTEIVAACDNDSAGNAYTQKIRAIAARSGRVCRDERPDGGDWNDLLRRSVSTPIKRPRPIS